MERKIYSQWAFTENCEEKGKINYEIYKELREKYKISDSDTYYDTQEKIRKPINLDDYDVVVKYSGTGYAHTRYNVLKNKPSLSIAELALICDDGNLCFGYRVEGKEIVIHTD